MWSGLDIERLGISELQFGKELVPRYKTSRIFVPAGHRSSYLRKKGATKIVGIIDTTAKGQDNDFFGRMSLSPFPSSGHSFSLPLYWNVYPIYTQLKSCLFPVLITAIAILWIFLI